MRRVQAEHLVCHILHDDAEFVVLEAGRHGAHSHVAAERLVPIHLKVIKLLYQVDIILDGQVEHALIHIEARRLHLLITLLRVRI